MREELDLLLVALAEGRMDPAGKRRLEELLADDPDARQTYYRYMSLHADLAWRFGSAQKRPAGEELAAADGDTLSEQGSNPRLASDDNEATSTLLLQIIEEQNRFTQECEARSVAWKKQLQAEQSRSGGVGSRGGGGDADRYVIVIPRWSVVGALAAAVLLALLLLWPGSTPPPTPGGPRAQTPAPAPVQAPIPAPAAGYVVQALDAGWGLDGGSPAADGALTPGGYQLTRGWVKLRTAHEVEIVLQAGSSFEIGTDNRMQLHTGQLVASVPPAAVGFTIDTPGGRVVDHGTEFGVTTQTQGDTQAYVFRGEIELLTGGDRAQGRSLRLQTGEAAGVGQSRVYRTLLRGEQFVRAQEFDARVRAAQGSVPDQRWVYRVELMRRPDLLAYYDFRQVNVRDGRAVENLALPTRGRLDAVVPVEQGGLELVPGRWPQDQALSLRPNRACPVVVDWAQVTPLKQMTIAGWVRIRSEQPWHIFLSAWSDRRVADGVYDDRVFHFGVAGRDNSFDALGPRLALHYLDAADERRAACDEANNGTQTPPDGHWVFVAATIDAQARTATLFKNGVQIASGHCDWPGDVIGAIAMPLTIGGKDGVAAGDFEVDELLLFDTVLDAQQIRWMYESGGH